MQEWLRAGCPPTPQHLSSPSPSLMDFIVSVSKTQFLICVVSQPGRLLINNQPIKLKFDCPKNFQVMYTERRGISPSAQTLITFWINVSEQMAAHRQREMDSVRMLTLPSKENDSKDDRRSSRRGWVGGAGVNCYHDSYTLWTPAAAVCPSRVAVHHYSKMTAGSPLLKKPHDSRANDCPRRQAGTQTHTGTKNPSLHKDNSRRMYY